MHWLRRLLQSVNIGVFLTGWVFYTFSINEYDSTPLRSNFALFGVYVLCALVHRVIGWLRRRTNCWSPRRRVLLKRTSLLSLIQQSKSFCKQTSITFLNKLCLNDLIWRYFLLHYNIKIHYSCISQRTRLYSSGMYYQLDFMKPTSSANKSSMGRGSYRTLPSVPFCIASNGEPILPHNRCSSTTSDVNIAWIYTMRLGNFCPSHVPGLWLLVLREEMRTLSSSKCVSLSIPAGLCTEGYHFFQSRSPAGHLEAGDVELQTMQTLVRNSKRGKQCE